MSTNAKLFLVDDEMMAVNYLRSLIEETSPTYSVVGEAYNGTMAIKAIEKSLPDIVFFDISMPVMNGLELAKRILEQYPQMRVVLLTSYKDFDYVKKGITLGVSAYILKNELTKQKLAEIIEKIMDELLSEKEKSRPYIERNLRQFLNQQSQWKEDNIYNNKPLRRFALILFRKKPQISFTYDQEEELWIDTEELELITFPQGLLCRNVVYMGNNIWCCIFFIEPEIAESVTVLQETAKLIDTKLCEQNLQLQYVISQQTKYFLELPQLYQQNKQFFSYVYGDEEENIYLETDLKELTRQELDITDYTNGFVEALKEENMAKAVSYFDHIIAYSRNRLMLYDYVQELRMMFDELRRYCRIQNLDENLLTTKTKFASVQELEEELLDYVYIIGANLEKRREAKYSYSIEIVLRYIATHFEKDISVNDIADAVGLSEGHLRKRFKNETGETIINYLTKYRLERAKEFM